MSLEDKKPKGMTMQKLDSIKEYFWKSFSSRFGPKYCSESKDDITNISLLKFSRNDRFLLVITQSLLGFILETETWSTLNFIDLKKLNYTTSPEGNNYSDKVILPMF